MSTVENDLQLALKHYFGFGKFKGLQEDVIKSIINNQKYVCYNAYRWRKIIVLPITRPC